MVHRNDLDALEDDRIHGMIARKIHHDFHAHGDEAHAIVQTHKRKRPMHVSACRELYSTSTNTISDVAPTFSSEADSGSDQQCHSFDGDQSRARSGSEAHVRKYDLAGSAQDFRQDHEYTACGRIEDDASDLSFMEPFFNAKSQHGVSKVGHDHLQGCSFSMGVIADKSNKLAKAGSDQCELQSLRIHKTSATKDEHNVKQILHANTGGLTTKARCRTPHAHGSNLSYAGQVDFGTSTITFDSSTSNIKLVPMLSQSVSPPCTTDPAMSPSKLLGDQKLIMGLPMNSAIACGKMLASSPEQHLSHTRKNLNVDSPSFTPAAISNINLNSPLNARVASAAPFTPRALVSGTTTPNPLTDPIKPLSLAHVREFTPQNYDTIKSGVADQHNFDNFNTQHTTVTTQFNPYNSMVGGSYYPPATGYTASQPLNHHLYAPQGITRADLTSYQRSIHDFFMPEKLREEVQKRSSATLLRLNVALPDVAPFHSLVALDLNVRGSSNVFGLASWVYKAQSSQDGHYYCLRRIEGCGLSNNPRAVECINTWQRVKSAGVVAVKLVFTTKNFKDSSLVFVHEYHPSSRTLTAHHSLQANGRTPLSTQVLWSYIVQLASAISAVHSQNLAVRCMDPSKIIVTGENRVRFGACGILDVMRYDMDCNRSIRELQVIDLQMFGALVVKLTSNMSGRLDPSFALASIKSQYGDELHEAVAWLLSQDSNRTINDFLNKIAVHVASCMDSSLHAADTLMSEFAKEAENGRIVRLLAKLSTINERPEHHGDPAWAENGERYQLKLMRDYIFHQTDSNGHSRIDFGHIITCLNKLDAGVDEKVQLIARDEQTIMIVSWKDLKKQVLAAFTDLTRTPKPSNPAGRAYPLS